MPDGFWWVKLLWMPGAIVGLIVSRNVHDVSISVLLSANAIFYAWITYLCLSAFHNGLILRPRCIP
jgi:hypothetical protein